MSADTDSNEKDPLVDLVKLGTDLVGGVGGAGIGFVVGGPAGALAGPAAGIAATHGLRAAAVEIKRRWLSSRQERRVGGVLAAAIADFDVRLSRGETPRSDNFVDPKSGESSAEEIVEQALLAARDEVEEKKVELIGRLTAGICFDQSITRQQAHNLLKTAERLSYRQLVMIRLFATPTPRPGFRANAYREQTSFSLELIHTLDEIHSLIRQGVLTNGPEIALGLSDVVPAQVRTQGVGAQMFNLMRLAEFIDPSTEADIAQQLV